MRKAIASITGYHDYYKEKQHKTLSDPLVIDTALHEQPDYDSMNKTDEHGNSYLDSIINVNKMYNHYFHTMEDEYRSAIQRYQGSEYVDVNETLLGNPTYAGRTIIRGLDGACASAPLLPKFLVTYRCFKHVVDLQSIQANPRMKTFISVSLSKNLADRWCSTGSTKFVMCVLLLPGTPGIIPIVYKKFSNYRENELLLDRNGYLFYTGITHNQVPVFVYLHKSIHRKDIDRFIESAKIQLEENLMQRKKRQEHYWDWNATDEDMAHPPNVIGGKRTFKKYLRNKTKRKIKYL